MRGNSLTLLEKLPHLETIQITNGIVDEDAINRISLGKVGSKLKKMVLKSRHDAEILRMVEARQQNASLNSYRPLASVSPFTEITFNCVSVSSSLKEELISRKNELENSQGKISINLTFDYSSSALVDDVYSGYRRAVRLGEEARLNIDLRVRRSSLHTPNVDNVEPPPSHRHSPVTPGSLKRRRTQEQGLNAGELGLEICTISLSGLACVGSEEGKLFFATTNYVYELATKSQTIALFNQFYPPSRSPRVYTT
ncbi:hypothetical protein JOM56_001800 [Amanita muscaria]